MQRLAGVLILISVVSATLTFSLAVAEQATPYTIVDGKVDRSTFLGWRVFHSACHGCHGVDASGTSVAPNLVKRITKLSPRDFSTKVLTRYRLSVGPVNARGDDKHGLHEVFLREVMRRERGELIMPAWGADPNVKPHVLDIYAYLRARADRALGPGRPESFREDSTNGEH